MVFVTRWRFKMTMVGEQRTGAFGFTGKRGLKKMVKVVNLV
ncbi:hypothetical protein Hanom_Chr12g01072621 [Helianthus anomalus]